MNAPLADRIRPKTLDDVVGQQHILGPNKVLRRIIESGTIPNMVFYGPSGVGKTTVASIIAKQSHMHLCKLNGTTASTADIRDVVAQVNTLQAVNGVLLYLDEIQYFNKKQQQTLLEFIENGSITLIASTTENPYFYVYNAILSRSTVFEFKPVEKEEVARAVDRAFRILSEDLGEEIRLEDGVTSYIASACGGDVRKAMNAAELCTAAVRSEDEPRITMELAEQLTQRSAMRYDRDGDAHYDILSAFQKSMRGSDVGLAWPQIIPIVKAAVDAAMMVGLPEARIPLADAVILTATAPKSNSGESAIDAAMRDVKAGKLGVIPRTLQNVHYDGSDVAKKGQFYRYPHDYPDHWLDQQYLPDALLGASYYHYGDNKNEQAFKAYWENIKRKHSS